MRHVRKALNRKMGRVMTIGVERGDEIEEIRIRPIKENNEGLLDKYSATYGILFIAQDAPEEFVKYNPIQALTARRTNHGSLQRALWKLWGR